MTDASPPDSSPPAAAPPQPVDPTPSATFAPETPEPGVDKAQPVLSTDPAALDTYERDDRQALLRVFDGMESVVIILETHQLIEKYGLSVVFHPNQIEWMCVDPKGLYRGTANTPAGAVFAWDCMRDAATAGPPAQPPEAPPGHVSTEPLHAYDGPRAPVSEAPDGDTGRAG